MDERDQHLNRLKLAEQQFRLACTVNLAVTNYVQTLDVPVLWTFGRHKVSYEDFGLRKDQAEGAASQLEMTATFVIAAAIRDAIVALFETPKSHNDQRVVAAYQISRIIRNAFAHSMIYPRWSIDNDCRDKVFEIADVIKLDTHGLSDRPLDWRHYGGPLAMFHFGRFVRIDLLGDQIDPKRQKPPYPTVENYQQGRLVMRKIDQLPDGVVPLQLTPGESRDLGDGWSITALPKASQ
jgi:hypothetical protein